MYVITGFNIDKRCLTPGGIYRGEEKGLEMSSILPEDREGDYSGDVKIYGGDEKFGNHITQNIIRWGIGESLGHKCFVNLDNKNIMSFNEYWEHGNAYNNYMAMVKQPEYYSEGELQSAEQDFKRAVLVYSAHEVAE